MNWATLNNIFSKSFSAFEGMVITFGSCRGAGVFNGWNLPSFAVGFIKGRTLFSEKYWKTMGQEMPK